jgi:hypothetical protein
MKSNTNRQKDSSTREGESQVHCDCEEMSERKLWTSCVVAESPLFTCLFLFADSAPSCSSSNVHSLQVSGHFFSACFSFSEILCLASKLCDLCDYNFRQVIYHPHFRHHARWAMMPEHQRQSVISGQWRSLPPSLEFCFLIQTVNRVFACSAEISSSAHGNTGHIRCSGFLSSPGKSRQSSRSLWLRARVQVQTWDNVSRTLLVFVHTCWLLLIRDLITSHSDALWTLFTDDVHSCLQSDMVDLKSKWRGRCSFETKMMSVSNFYVFKFRSSTVRAESGDPLRCQQRGSVSTGRPTECGNEWQLMRRESHWW